MRDKHNFDSHIHGNVVRRNIDEVADQVEVFLLLERDFHHDIGYAVDRGGVYRVRDDGPGVDRPSAAQAFPTKRFGTTVFTQRTRSPPPPPAIAAALHLQFVSITRLPKGFGVKFWNGIGEVLCHD
jgi:hypothetical protein